MQSKIITLPKNATLVEAESSKVHHPPNPLCGVPFKEDITDTIIGSTILPIMENREKPMKIQMKKNHNNHVIAYHRVETTR